MGKEGNQASSFADYAIPNFKSLRRLLFWHGSFISMKLTNYCLWMLNRSMLFGCSVWFFNFYTGMSGIHTVDDILWTLNPVLLANNGCALYAFLDQPVSNSKHGLNEERLPFKMSKFYENTRSYVLEFKLRFLISALYCWLMAILLALTYFEH